VCLSVFAFVCLCDSEYGCISVFEFVNAYVCGCDNEYVCMSEFVLFVCLYLCGWVLMYVGVE
jgi:hypothetical protein